jgi:hypothetical protein
MRAQLVRPVVASAVTGFAFVSVSWLGQALAASAANSPIVNSACSSIPKGAELLASVTTEGTSGTTPAVLPTTSSSASASPTAKASPKKHGSPTPKPSSSSKKGTTSSSPTTSISPAPSSSPTPTPSPSSSSSPTAQVCVKVQSFSTSSQVTAGKTANFAVWVWSAKAPSDDVSVSVGVAYAMYVKDPSFTVCPDASGHTCKLGDMPAGEADELQVQVPVGAQAALGEQVQLTAKATASTSSFSGSATDVVVAATPSPTTEPTSSAPGPVLPPVTLPPVAQTGVTPGNPSGLFPTVAPASPATSAPTLPQAKPHKSVRVADVAATVPLDPRLIGGQLVGLAVLAGAVAVAIARLSLRTPKAPEDRSDR